MTGTPSRTATAYDGGTTRHSAAAEAAVPQGYVGRKLQAKLRSEGHEAHMRQPNGGRGRVGVQSPKVIRTRGCICDGYMERKSRALPREICLSVRGTGSERGLGTALKEGQAGRGRMYPAEEQTTYAAGPEERTREAARSTKGSQKSAESISCQRTATKEEHMETNRNGAFDG
jgi:hypothetical protein